MKAKGYSFILVALAALFCVALVTSNVIAGKLYQAPGSVVLPAAVWLFPIVYIIGDVIPEVYGLATARRIILLGFAANLLAVGFFALTLALPAPGFWHGQSAFTTVLGLTPRLLVASFVAYLIGTNANAAVLVTIKKWTGGRWLWMRTIGSTIVGEGLDSACFITIAFLGTVPPAALPGMILAQAAFKTAYEALATPLTYAVVGAVKRAEGSAPAPSL
jgi:queuosine precursor transporter